mmetsp:Transcript_24303/g.74945  ORF Transcript_24303/g.74945 Transcript_24303/m.74945 type:complete len:341 (+) Transcript_24303:325-1347(+)
MDPLDPHLSKNDLKTIGQRARVAREAAEAAARGGAPTPPMMHAMAAPPAFSGLPLPPPPPPPPPFPGLTPQTTPVAFAGLAPTTTPPVFGAPGFRGPYASWSEPTSPMSPITPLTPLTPAGRAGRPRRSRRGSRGGPIRPDPSAGGTIAGDAEYQLRTVDAAITDRDLPPVGDHVRALVEHALQASYPGAVVEVFGSCASNLASPESDVDLVAHGHAGLKRGDGAAAIEVKRILEAHLGESGAIRDFAATPHARVPVVTFAAAFPDGSDRVATVDLTLGNAEVVWNSRLIREFGRHAGGDARRLLRLARFWARQRRISTVYRLQTPSPYAHCLLVISFLV